MNEDFDLPVIYRGEEMLFTSRLLQGGYAYKIEVDLPAGSVLFEKDEGGDWRALSQPEGAEDFSNSAALFEAVAIGLNAVFEWGLA